MHQLRHISTHTTIYLLHNDLFTKGFRPHARAVLNAVQGNGIYWCIYFVCLLLLLALLGLWTSNVGITNEDIIRIYFACEELYLDPAQSIWNIGVRTYGADNVRGTKYVPLGQAMHAHSHVHTTPQGQYGETNADCAQEQEVPAASISTSQESQELSAGMWSPITLGN